MYNGMMEQPADGLRLPNAGDNPNLGFITREEFRAGIDATLFNRLLKINAELLQTRYERLAHPRFIFYLSFLFCFKQQFHFHALDQL